MSIFLNLFFAVPIMMLFAAVLSVATVVCGCGWPISAMAVHMDVTFWKFSDNNPDSYVCVCYRPPDPGVFPNCEVVEF